MQLNFFGRFCSTFSIIWREGRLFCKDPCRTSTLIKKSFCTSCIIVINYRLLNCD